MNFIPRTPFDRVALGNDSLTLAAIGCTEPGFQYFPFSFMVGSTGDLTGNFFRQIGSKRSASTK